MEAFSLLKYWRGGGGAAADDGDGGDGANVRSAVATRTTKTTVTAIGHHPPAEEGGPAGDDDGPFFDLEFASLEEDREDDVESDGTTDGENENENENEREEFMFALSSSGDVIADEDDDQNVSLPLSPSDDLFFKGKLVPIEPDSFVFNGSDSNPKTQFFFSKSATKFRVLMLKFKKSKPNVTEKTETQKQSQTETQKQSQTEKQSKFLTVKFKVEELVRENSSRINSQKKQSSDELGSDEKRFSKDVMQRYLNKVKPLYIRVSKRYSEKLRFSGQLSLGSSPPPAKSAAAKSDSEPKELVEPPPPQTSAGNGKSQKQGNFPAGLRVACKRLGKSRSAPAAVETVAGSSQGKRRDDSLLQHEDGIQGAILHCKRSFNSSRDSESSLLVRSVSDQSHDKPKNCLKKCPEELRGTTTTGI